MGEVVLSVLLVVAGGLAAVYRQRWLFTYGHAGRLALANAEMHEHFGKAMDVCYRREEADRARKAQLREIIEERFQSSAPTDAELDAARQEEYARLVKPT